MIRSTWSKPDGSWGIEGVDLSTLPPRVYGALMKLKHIEDDGDRFQKAFVLACRLLGDGRWEAVQEDLLDTVDTEPVCRVCGCTQHNACPGECHWVEADLCSACAASCGSPCKR